MLSLLKKITFLTLIVFLPFTVAPFCFADSLESDYLSDFPPADLTRLVLDNGLVVVVKKVETTSMVTVAAFIGAGSADEGEFSGSGISHLIEHMLFKGTSRFGVGEIGQKIKSYGGTINGFTSFDYTGYQAVVQNQYLDQTLKILQSMLTEATFDPEEFAKEKEVVINEINLNQDDPQWQLQRLFLSTIYTAHPYRLPIIGQAPAFKKLTREEAIDFYRNTYVPNRSVLVVCGNVDPKEAISKIEEIFKNWPGNFSSPDASLSEPRQLGRRRVDKPSPVKLSHIMLGFHTVSLSSEDMYPLDVLASILGSKKSSRLNQEISKKLGLVYSINASSFTPVDNGIFSIYAQSDPEKTNAAISAILKEIDKINSGKIKKKELERAKDEVLTDYLFAQERIESLAYSLASDELIAHDLNFSRRYVEKIKAVGVKDLKKVAQKYFTLDNLTVATIFPEEEKETVQLSAEPAESRREERIEKFILPNGLTVLLKENPQLPIVSLRVYFLAGVRTEDESNNGLSNLTAQMLLAGTKSKKASEIAELIENKGGGIGTISGNNSIGLSLDLLKEHLDTGLMVLADLLTNATFPQEELEKEKEKILAAIKSQDDDIFRTASNLFKETLYREHPYRFPLIGKEETIENISRQDLLNFYKNYINSQRGVLAIVGDIDQEETLSAVKKYFKGLNSVYPSPINVAGEPEGKELSRADKVLNKEQAIVILGFKTIKVDDQDRYTFELLSGIISGRGKLFEEIRNKLALAYTLGAYSVPGLESGYYLFYVATTSENKEKVKELLLGQVEKLKSGYLSEKDIRLAKNYLISQEQLGRQANSALANQMALDELYGLGFNNYQRYAGKIEKVNGEDLKRIANKYFKLDQAAMVVVGPK